MQLAGLENGHIGELFAEDIFDLEGIFFYSFR